MKKLFTILPIFLMLGAVSSNAQIFWNENFESGSASGLTVPGYTGPNGTWTLTTSISTAEGDTPNPWFVSCAEAGHVAGGCGTTCSTGIGLGATLHIGSGPGSLGGVDNGASYDAGGGCGIVYCTQTDRRAESPTINCTGKTNIKLRFYYIENGQTTLDDGSVWYYDGTTWSLLINTAKTTLCSGQGLWAQQVVMLPASANNNPNVKIGFRWVNNDDGVGTDPSFAIDSVTLSTPSAAPTPVFTMNHPAVCQDSCITFTSTTVGADSIRWAVVGVPLTSTVNPLVQCFTSPVPAGTYLMRLYAFAGGLVDSVTQPFTINPAPHPAATKSGHTISVPAVYTGYQWYNGSTAIVGATNASYTYTTSGVYMVVVDSAGCKGSSIVFNTVGVAMFNGLNNDFWIAQPNNSSPVLYSANPVDETITVTIYDATGRKADEDSWSTGSNSKQLNTGNLAPGLYIIKLSNRNTSMVMKWMK